MSVLGTFAEETTRSATDAAARGYCCGAKLYFSTNNNVARSLEICPRVLIFQKSFKVKNESKKIITIKNRSLYARSMKIHTDSTDTAIKMHPLQMNRYLEPDETLSITVIIKPRAKDNINHPRRVYIESTHPNIIFEVPILVTLKEATPYLPPSIRFPSTTPGNKTYYELAAFNPSKEPLPILIKTMAKHVRWVLKANVLPRFNHLVILFELEVFKMEGIVEDLKIKLGKAIAFNTVPFEHEPLSSCVHLNKSHIDFKELKFERSDLQEFTICNESYKPLIVNIDFMRPESETNLNDSEPDTEPNIENNFNIEDLLREPASNDSLSSPSIKRVEKEDDPNYFGNVDYKHFTVQSFDGKLEPQTGRKISITFQPILNSEIQFDDTIVPPFRVRAKLLFYIQEPTKPEKFIILGGYIRGPDMEFQPTVIDFRKIYVGEEHCGLIRVLNVDGQVRARVYFKDYDGKEGASVQVKPQTGFNLDPCQHGIFQFTMFLRKIGKFLFKMYFKVFNGDYYEVIVKGHSVPVRINAFPDIIELGSIPVAVPQKRFVLLMNPLSVPIALKCVPTEDGTEIPLTLQLQNVVKMLPVTVFDPVHQLKRAKVDEKEKINDDVTEYKIEIVSTANSMNSFKSVLPLSNETSYSTVFQEDIIDNMSEYAHMLVTNLKAVKFFDKPEIEKRVLNEAVDIFLKTDYFQDLCKYQNYAYMDWNALPTDPKEIYCDNDIIYLQPNAGKSITVLVIPNSVGYHNRSIDIRICPIDHGSAAGDENKEVIKSDMMITKLWIEYNCQLPALKWNNIIDLRDQIIYTGNEYPFNMLFDNEGLVGGFVYYDVVPDSSDGVIRFHNNQWKFYVFPSSALCVSLTVKFYCVGEVTLSGIVKYVGKVVGMPFHVTAKVLPTKLRVTPMVIYRRQKVLEKTRFYVFIENMTPTNTLYTVALRDNSTQYIQGKGGILSPHGQVDYIIIFSKYSDAEIYKNVLYIDLKFDRMEIPMTFVVTGTPLFFQPDITNAFDTGLILVSSKHDCLAERPNYTQFVKVINRGNRAYRINMHNMKRTNQNQGLCDLPTLKSQINILPKTLLIGPGAEEQFLITAFGCDTGTITNDFRIEIVDQEDRKRVTNYHTSITAHFTQPQLIWDRREIVINYKRTHVFNENMILEYATLTNLTDIPIGSVELRTVGPFRIKELFEDKFSREMKFSLQNLDSKVINIVLNKGDIKQQNNVSLSGRILLTCNGKVEKSLPIKVNVITPNIVILEPILTLFSNYKERDTTVGIFNISPVDAQYKWKKISETCLYIADFDDSRQNAEDILSDILRMIDFDDYEESDTDVFGNLTLRYQKYRCRLLKMQAEDRAWIANIIDSVINDLDLEHRHYMLSIDDHICPGDSMDNEEVHGDKSYIDKTIDKVLEFINLDHSYTMSEASTESCQMKNEIYFYDKKSVLQSQQRMEVLLHLPPVRIGYAIKACFEMEIFGGETRNFEITIGNLNETMRLSRASIFIRARPWYEQYKARVKLFNITPLTFLVSMEKVERSINHKCSRFSQGYVQLNSDSSFVLPLHSAKTVSVQGIMGFTEKYNREYIIRNDRDQLRLRVHGQGIMPYFCNINRVPTVQLATYEIEAQYRLLQKIYYFEIFNSFTEEDEELPMGDEECFFECSKSESDISLISSSSDTLYQEASLMHSDSSMNDIIRLRKIRAAERERRFFRLMQTYVMVNPNEVPNCIVLEQLFDTQRFLEILSVNDDACFLLNLVYEQYLKEPLSYDSRIPTNLKHMTVQPLPFNAGALILNLGELPMRKRKNFNVVLQFFGPGKILASARTIVKIPNLTVNFEVKNADTAQGVEFLYYSSAHNKIPDDYCKRYRNMYERDIDAYEDPKIKHAHSFDFDGHSRHMRAHSVDERKAINDYYNSLVKSVYLERKHHYILSKVLGKSKNNYTGNTLHIKMCIRPNAKHYEVDQLIEDYLFVDLHLGPTLPILLRGLIVNDLNAVPSID